MKLNSAHLSLLLVLFILFGCKNQEATEQHENTAVKNEIQYAKGFEIYKYNGFSILKVTQPWPNATKAFTYVLKEKNTIVPDSLKQFTTVTIPIQSIVVTSTTHIPSLEILGVEKSLVGFPNTDYISSEKTRKNIDAGTVREVGKNENLNTEVLIDLAPEAIVGFGLSNSNPSLDILEKS
ncbi:MAG: ABC transporter substrate-binding protein, partial [Bacteroidetes bacterium]|nr:ABC transporter substrate-binding protein [Bacteroidota bacterium]